MLPRCPCPEPAGRLQPRLACQLTLKGRARLARAKGPQALCCPQGWKQRPRKKAMATGRELDQAPAATPAPSTVSCRSSSHSGSRSAAPGSWRSEPRRLLLGCPILSSAPARWWTCSGAWGSGRTRCGGWFQTALASSRQTLAQRSASWSSWSPSASGRLLWQPRSSSAPRCSWRQCSRWVLPSASSRRRASPPARFRCCLSASLRCLWSPPSRASSQCSPG
mmetsp:Transcript_2194/g.5188  ORF Transcript_2194/g.5188 Transcript_2194/m.5188 type:complete len:222 (-) Transcript_2194:823-1488(-)